MTNPDSPVRGEDLDSAPFDCCSNVEPHPHRCPDCGFPLVYCLECGTLYPALPDTSRQDMEANLFEPARPSHACPRCGFEFEYAFTRNPAYAITRAQWSAAGLDGLLTRAEDRPPGG